MGSECTTGCPPSPSSLPLRCLCRAFVACGQGRGQRVAGPSPLSLAGCTIHEHAVHAESLGPWQSAVLSLEGGPGSELICTPLPGPGADRTSDVSSVSLEVGPGSRETSAATLSPGVSGHGWDDSDNRSEHSYSESGASGSSFEELDLEGEGSLGEPRPSPEAEPLGTPKWARELSTPEKGEE